jgi:hypothetical protein
MKYGETLVAFFDSFSHLMSGTMRSGRREYISAYGWTPGPINGTAAEALTMMLADAMGQVLADLPVVAEEAVGED